MISNWDRPLWGWKEMKSSFFFFLFGSFARTSVLLLLENGWRRNLTKKTPETNRHKKVKKLCEKWRWDFYWRYFSFLFLFLFLHIGYYYWPSVPVARQEIKETFFLFSWKNKSGRLQRSPSIDVIYESFISFSLFSGPFSWCHFFSS